MSGAPLAAGRTFTAAEDSPNGGHVVVRVVRGLPNFKRA